MEAGLDHVSQLFVATFEGFPDGGPPAVEDGINPGDPAIEASEMDALDELALDESKAYKTKITKYIRNSLACVKEAMFFTMMLVGNLCREPLLHHYRFLCQKLISTSMHVVDLVTSHLQTIECEFNELLETFEDWSQKLVTTVRGITTCHPLNAEDLTVVSMACLSVLLHNAACFDRRIIRQFSRHDTGKQLFMVYVMYTCTILIHTMNVKYF